VDIRTSNTFNYSIQFEYGYLLDYFLFRLKAAMDRNCARWLSVQWVTADRPRMTSYEWENLVEKVALMAEKGVVRG
jgi:hypothetical protein